MFEKCVRKKARPTDSVLGFIAVVQVCVRYSLVQFCVRSPWFSFVFDLRGSVLTGPPSVCMFPSPVFNTTRHRAKFANIFHSEIRHLDRRSSKSHQKRIHWHRIFLQFSLNSNFRGGGKVRGRKKKLSSVEVPQFLCSGIPLCLRPDAWAGFTPRALCVTRYVTERPVSRRIRHALRHCTRHGVAASHQGRNTQ